MASAIRQNTPVYVLTLSEDEAKALRMILRFIGGRPSTTRRGLASNISEALDNVGLHDNELADIEGVLRFQPRNDVSQS